jgi:hypothetical protein
LLVLRLAAFALAALFGLVFLVALGLFGRGDFRGGGGDGQGLRGAAVGDEEGGAQGAEVQARTQGRGGGAGLRSVVCWQEVALLHGGRPLGVCDVAELLACFSA